MSNPASRSRYLTLGGLEVHFTEWGAADAPAIVMWHGLARTCRDFDTAAARLSTRFRVICPDTVGRGLSSWSANPEQDYTVAAYAGHALELLDKLGIERLRWVGTSMGGVVGMLLAAGPLKGRIEKLVVNDIGPRLNPAAVERIRAYVTTVPSFATMAEFHAFLRFIYQPFGALSEADWTVMAETSVRRQDDGRLTLHYDPKVMQVFAAAAGEFDMWPVWDLIECPTLALRGANSDLLLADTAGEMTTRGPKARLVTIPACGHAPALNVPAQLEVLEEFLGS
ncbi:MAG: alpha/beta hydrolase [Magnetospirillum sp.]|nr:alpha/beta hydrolase [Magnetospirillum sp.]